jgi:photosystem II stability/assembly factor-like uncharacterized protein
MLHAIVFGTKPAVDAMRLMGRLRRGAGAAVVAVGVLTTGVGTTQASVPLGLGAWQPSSGWFAAPQPLSSSLSVGSSTEAGTIVFAAPAGRGVFASADGGYGWVPQGNGPHSSFAVAADPSDPTIVYQAGLGVWRSDDAGSTWRPAGLDGQFIAHLVVESGDGQTVYAVTGSGELWLTTNGGTNWALVPVPIITAVRGAAITIDPGTGALIVGSTAGLYESASGRGDDWSALSGAPDCPFEDLAQDGSASGIYAATGEGCSNTPGTEVYRSADHGAHWTLVLSLPWDGMVIGVSIASVGNRVILTRQDGVYTSGDAGATFHLVNQAKGLVNWQMSRHLTGGAPEQRESSGQHQRRSTGRASNPGLYDYDAYTVALDPAKPGRLLAAASEIDSRRVRTGAVERRGALALTGLAIAPTRSAPSTCGPHDGVLVSHDGGTTFGPTSLSHGQIDSLTISPLNGAVFAGAQNGGFFECTDSGGTWNDLSSLLPDASINAIAIPPASPRARRRWWGPRPTSKPVPRR